MKYIYLALCIAACNNATKESKENNTGLNENYNEPHRPQIHFSPKANWMNDPNGLVYYNGIYHMFFQYYPDSTVWGPMHWGHATSTDLIHWNEKEIALFPDTLGYIFSGSAVADQHNTSGFGKDGKVPLVAIFTYHDTTDVNQGRNDYQTQGLAYSIDEGSTWIKYEKNPVLRNPGIKDFRDPKIMWYEAGKKWIMTLATLDRISFYSSANLKDWIKESEFGSNVGAHGGVWECPDLIPFDYNGKTIWVLFVSINPGGPNGGSGTQYFTGNFDGKYFTPFQTDIRWVDYGPDNYAGVTWSNVGNRKLFIGWMSNWQYAQAVPTDKWRSAMTIPRDIGIVKRNERFLLTSTPSKEIDQLRENSKNLTDINANDFDISKESGNIEGPCRIKFQSAKIDNFTLTLFNKEGEKLVLGYDKAANQYFIDRSASGKIKFEKGFGVKHTAPRIETNEKMEIDLIIDNASIELFADSGLTVMTAIFFPTTTFSDIRLHSNSGFKINSLEFVRLKSIWK